MPFQDCIIVGRHHILVAYSPNDLRRVVLGNNRHLGNPPAAHLFKGGPAPNPECRADVDNNDGLNVADLTFMVDYLFKGGPAPDPDCCNPQW